MKKILDIVEIIAIVVIIITIIALASVSAWHTKNPYYCPKDNTTCNLIDVDRNIRYYECPECHTTYTKIF